MTKAELIERVASRKDLPRTLSKKSYAKIIEAVFTEVGDYFIRARPTISNPPRFTYPGFGTFTKRRRGPRTVRNPLTQAPIEIPSQCTVSFAPGNELKGLMNMMVRPNKGPQRAASSTAARSESTAEQLRLAVGSR
jgi:nucleoid DNA-binding protein